MPITHDFITLDSCDDPSAWTPMGQASISLNTIDYKQGSGAINVYKSGTAGVDFGAYKTIASTNVKNKVIAFWLYISSNSTLKKLTKARFYIYDSSGNYFYWDLKPIIGWNKFVIIPNTVETISNLEADEFHGYYVRDGSSPTAPDLTKIVKIAFYFETYSSSDTITEGSIVIDYIVLGTTITITGGTVSVPLTPENIKKDLDSSLLPIYKYDGTNIFIHCQIVIEGVVVFVSHNLTVTQLEGYALWIKKGGYLRFGEKLTVNNENYGIKGASLSIWRPVYIGDYYLIVDGEFYFYGSTVNIYGNEPDTLRFIFEGTVELINSEIRGYYITISSPVYIYDSEIYTTALVIFEAPPKLARLLTISGVKRIVYSKVNNPPYGLIMYEPIFAPGTTIVTYYISQFTLRDPIIPPSEYLPEAPTSGAQAWLQYSFQVQLVDEGGNPIANANYVIYNSKGEVEANGTTDSNGYTSLHYLTQYHWYYDTATASVIKEDWNPHRIVVTKGSIKYQDYVFTIDKKFRGVIPIHTMWKGNTWSRKTSYQLNENVIIYAMFQDWLDKPVTGLTVNATITKPDGTQMTISLRDDGIPPDEVANDGIYTGQFVNTDQVGTYYVEIETRIYGNVVKARTSFDVGKIEKKIDDSKMQIISEMDKMVEEIKNQIKLTKPGASFRLG